MKIVELGTVAAIERRGVDPSSIAPDTLYLGLEHIERGGRIIGRDTVGGAELASTKFQFTAEHVLFGKLRPNLGKISRPRFAGVCSTDILPIRPGENLDRDYLAHYLAQPSMIDFAASRTSGANLPRLSPTVLATFPIPLPPLPEQRRIAAILDHADALRAKRRQILTHLNSLTQSIFSDMFPGEAETERVPLGDLATLVTKGTTPTSVGLKFSLDGVPFLRAQNLQHGAVAFGPGDLFIDEDADLALRRSRIVPRDLLVSIAGTIGRVALVPEQSPTMNCNQAVAIVRLLEPETGPWLRAWLASSDALSQIGASAVTGTIANLSLGQIRQLKVPIVGADEAKEFNRRSASVEAAKDAVADVAATEHELFTSLQSRAFRGEL